MDIEQLTGFVRNELAKVSALTIFDEVLTVVRDSQRLIEQATKELADIERQTQNKAQSLVAMEIELQSKREDFDKELASKLADHQATLHEFSKKHAQQQNDLLDRVGALKSEEGVLSDKVAALKLTVSGLEADTKVAEREYGRVKKVLTELKATL